MGKIRIEELSVGDWVNVDDPLQSGVGQIVEIRSNIVLVQVPSCVVGARLESIEPIPLTPEILEKNGFSHNGNKWYTPEELFTLERWSQGWSIVIACSCGDYVCEVCTIKSVHQLQHALRLAKVEKEVVL